MNNLSTGSKQPWSAIPLNSSAQFLFGILIIFVATKLWWTGWFSFHLMNATGMSAAGPESVNSPLSLIPIVLDSVCLVGVLGFSFLSFIRQAVGPILSAASTAMRHWMVVLPKAVGLQNQVVDSAPEEQTGERTTDDAKHLITRRQIDPAKLKLILEDFKQRIASLEKIHPEVLPPEPPTIESLLREVRDLKQKLGDTPNEQIQDNEGQQQ